MTQRRSDRPTEGEYYTVADEDGEQAFVKVEDVFLPGDEPLYAHDTYLHIKTTGAVGLDSPGCPRCDQTRGMPRSVTCPVCRRTSWHPEDVWQGYCGGCHAYTQPAWRERRD